MYEHASQADGKSTTGKLAAQAWLRANSLSTPAQFPWHAEVSFAIDDTPATVDFDDRYDTRLRVEIYSEEWGFFFCHGGRASWIRVTDIPFVHGRDDFNLLSTTPSLKSFGTLVRVIEKQHAIAFRRQHALVRTNIPSAEPAIRLWIQSL